MTTPTTNGEGAPAVPAWLPDPSSRSVDRRRVDDIAFTPMSTRLRNELITRTYGDIAEAMDAVLGTADTTWAGFGQWASHTVGGFLDLPVPGLGRVIGRAFADGNRDVFADIARAHVVFLETVGAAALGDGDLDEAWRRCEAALRRRLFDPPGRPGGAPDLVDFWTSTHDPRLPAPDGDDDGSFLVLGMRAYRRAITAEDREQRSRHVLLGNCLLALHEQKVLALAISMGFRGWLRTLTTPHRLLESRATWRNRDPGARRLRVEDGWIRFATERIIGVGLPDRRVRCGDPVPAGTDPVLIPARIAGAGRLASVGMLADLDDDTILTALFDRFGVDGRAATCWNDLADRMAFIMALFAAHQRSPIWRDDGGSLVRPAPWSQLDRELARLQARLALGTDTKARASAGDDRPTGAAPVSDTRLDELRSVPTGIDVADADRLGLDVVSRPGEQRLSDRVQSTFAAIEADVAARLDGAIRHGLLDPDTLAAARLVHDRWRTLTFLGLLVRSLPDSYGAGAGVEVLGRISDLATDPFRRAGETAQFVEDLLGGSGDLAGSVASIVGVRTMHSLVATRLTADGWDAARLGVPVNAEDALGAALAFGVAPLELLDQLAPDLLTDAERDAFCRFWTGVGHLLGVPLDVVTTEGRTGLRPLTNAEARSLAGAIRRRHRTRTRSGVRLTEALVEGVADGFPRPFFWLAPGLMEALGDDEITALLVVGGGVGRRRSGAVATVFGAALRARPTRRAMRPVVEAIGRWWLLPFLEQGRTRPYRRPTGPSDEDRLAVARLDALRWPVGCGGSPNDDRTAATMDRAVSSPPGPTSIG